MRGASTRIFRAVLASALLLGATTRARAGDPKPMLAEELFIEGRALMQAKDYARACPKFEEAYGYDLSAVGTLLNLALCREALGRFASAWTDFRTVAARSRGTREDRVVLAEDHAAALEPKRSWLRIAIPPEAQVPGLRVTLDGVELGPASLGTEFPLDPGKRIIEASALGSKPWSRSVEIGPVADHQAIALPTLEEAPPPAPLVRTEVRQVSPLRLGGFVAAGAGAAGVAAGLVVGLFALGKNGDANGRCPDHSCASASDASTSNADQRSAQQLAAASTVVTGLSLAVLAGGLVAIVVTPRATSTPPRAWLAPAAGTSGAGLVAGGEF